MVRLRWACWMPTASLSDPSAVRLLRRLQGEPELLRRISIERQEFEESPTPFRSAHPPLSAA